MNYCLICCDEKNNFYTCNSCKFTNCIDCHKTYLLGVTQDAHCLAAGCRVVIPYDIFLSKFGEKWIFGKYKEHRHKILWDREMAQMPATIDIAAQQRRINAKEAEKNVIKERMREMESEMFDSKTLASRYILLNENLKGLRKECRRIEQEIYALQNEFRIMNGEYGNSKKLEKKKYIYKYRCPAESCKGYLGEDNKCALCESDICMNCYSKKENNGHKCNPEKVESFKAIKKEAKPCPSCGEFISKISGCDQMFCTSCGSAFSWESGEIEKGIIHNPHAHAFFQNNPEAMEQYRRNRGGGGQAAAGAAANQCREHLPENLFFYHLKNGFYSKIVINDDDDYKEFSGQNFKDKLWHYHRYIAEFRQYRYRNLSRYITTPVNTNNQDLRIKYLNNDYDDRKLNIYLHKRDKAEYFNKQIFKMLVATFEIAEFMFWAFYDEMNESSNEQIIKSGIIHKYFRLLYNLIKDTNKNVRELCGQFNYIYHDAITQDFEYNTYWSRF